jgi:Xaa-Pro aminopeptidase
MTTDDKSRAAFEKWMSDDGISPRAVERSSDGYYKLMHTSNSWTAWSAAIAYASAEQKALLEVVRQEYRAAEMSAAIMRDPQRTGGWIGAERTAQAFDRIARKLKSALAAEGQRQ